MAKSTLKPLPLRVTEAELIEIDKLAAEYAGNNRKNLIMMALNDFKSTILKKKSNPSKTNSII
jgi:hypothetical protein